MVIDEAAHGLPRSSPWHQPAQAFEHADRERAHGGCQRVGAEPTRGAKAIVSLAQPARGNPFDGDFTRDFKQVFADLWDASGLRAGAAQLEAELEDEALTLARGSATADAQEGIDAMVERRKPVFRGC